MEKALSTDLNELIIKIKNKRKEDGYTVECKASNKHTLDEIVANMIKSHTM